MEWWHYLTIILGLLSVFFLSGLPVAFCFTLFNFIALFFWMGGVKAFTTLPLSAYTSVASFPLIAVPLFILMGELLFRSGVMSIVLDAAGKWIGGFRGSLSFTAVAAGTLFGTMSGSGMSGVAVLGSTLAPEMRRRGYSKEMTLGPILGSGTLAMIIPPSILAVVLGSLANIDVAQLLISGVVPGVVIAALYAVYIFFCSWLKPHLAPAYVIGNTSLGEKLIALLSILPVGIITLAIWGVIFFGIATPSEAAAMGVAGALVVIAIYRKLTWTILTRSVLDTTRITSMVFLIIMNAAAFGQILAFTGISRKLVGFVVDYALPPLLVMIAMQATLIVVGTFMDELAMLLVTIPVYMPIVEALQFDPVWFGLLILINLEVATISPPYGLALFVMKGVVPDATMGDVWRASLPYMLLGVIAMALVVTFPGLATWLPGLMR